MDDERSTMTNAWSKIGKMDKFERYKLKLLSRISYATAFDARKEFESEEEVREYFSPATQRFMFGEDAVTDEELLSEWADTVIEHRWHCAF